MTAVLWKSFLFFLVIYYAAGDDELCQNLDRDISDFHLDLLQTSIIRFVSFHENSTDSSACLCRGNPCATPRYALLGDGGSPLRNITLLLGAGVHRLDEGLSLHDASHISFIGVENTVVECGANPIFSNCSLLNVFINASSFIYFSGITFQNCQLGVPMVQIERSDNIIFEKCVFR